MAMMSSRYLFQRSGWLGGFCRTWFSISYIVNSAKTTEIGEPMGVPWSCLKIWSFHLKMLASLPKLRRSNMDSFGRDVFFSIYSDFDPFFTRHNLWLNQVVLKWRETSHRKKLVYSQEGFKFAKGIPWHPVSSSICGLTS